MKGIKFSTVLKYTVLIFWIYSISKLIWAYDMYAGPKANIGVPMDFEQIETTQL